MLLQQHTNGGRLAYTCSDMTPQITKALYTGKTHTIGGREGSSHSDDGRLDVQLSVPGSSGTGTNPEQLFAAGWSACFLGAIRLAAGRKKIVLPPGLGIDAEVDLCSSEGDYFLATRLNVSLPGLDQQVAKDLVEAAHQTCPYSKATRGNVNVTLNVRTN